MDRCIYCECKRVYKLSNDHIKCPCCKRKFSLKKIERDFKLIEYFCKDFNALETSKIMGLSYVTVKNRFLLFRKLISLYLEKEYENKKEVIEFDEYLYLEKNKRNDKKNIFDAYNFLTFDYGGKIYNLMMPDLSRYKTSYLEDGLEEIYYKEFEQFLKLNRIAKLKSSQNLITRFWNFFESFINSYKGVSRENFFYYLKEAEFKFNFPKNERVEILKKIYIDSFKETL
ncbi:transposase [Nitrosophilus labii]|uniref:transposase n=1 Tax=Nitrosophilus labii TaxID=2706014 RepID=UPI0016571DEB|nr:transposase [Nitrosophilus labii]